MPYFSPTNYSMKWQNFQAHLAEEMAKLLQKESMVDVTLRADNGTFQAHRIVLSASSPYFQKIFAEIDPDYHPIVILSDVSASDLQTILDFIYNGEIKVEKANISSVLKTAEDLNIEALKDIKKYLLDNPITSTENSDVELIVKTPPTSNIPEAPKASDQTNLVGLPCSSLQGSLTKGLIQDPGRKHLSPDSSKKPLNLNDLLLASPKSTPSKSNPILLTNSPSKLNSSPSTNSSSKQNSILSSNFPSKSNETLSTNCSNKTVLSVKTDLFLNKTTSPVRLPVRKPIPLHETNMSRVNTPLKSASHSDSTSSKTNSVLPCNSFTSLDTSWSFPKSVLSLDGDPLAFDFKAKPSVDSLVVANPKDSKLFVLDNFNTEAKQNDSVLTVPSEMINEAANSSNTEIHVLRYEDLEEEIMKKEEDPLSAWLLLKTPKGKENAKDNMNENNTEICVVNPGDFFTQVNDAKEVHAPGPSHVSSPNPPSPDVFQPLQRSTLSQMAESLNVPRSTLYYRSKSSGMDLFLGREVDPEADQRLMDACLMVKEGSTLVEACRKYGVSKTVLWRKVNKELGRRALTVRSQLKSRYTQNELQKAHQELREGENAAKVAKKYNIPPATLHRVQNRLIDEGLLHKEKISMPRYDKDYRKSRNLLQAVKAVLEYNIPMNQAAVDYNVPKATLWRKVTQISKNLPVDIVEYTLEDFEAEECDDPDGLEEGDDNEEFSIQMEEGSDKCVFLEGSKISACNEDADEQSFLLRDEGNDEDMEAMDDTPYILVTNDTCLKI